MDNPQDALRQRIKILIDELEGGVQRRFALTVGVHATTIGEILGKRQNQPSSDLLHKIAVAYPQLRTDWLLLGEGEMLKTDPQKTEALKNLPYMRPRAGAPEPGLAADLVSQLPTEEKPGPGDINIGVVPQKRKQPVGTDLIKQVAKNTADIEQLFELLRGGASVSPDAPHGNTPDPADARH